MNEHSPGGFLSRWSRLKRAHEQTLTKPQAPTQPSAADDAAQAQPEPTPAASASPTLPPEQLPADWPRLDSISLETDFTPFMQQDKLPEWFRRQALRTLFRDPHFNRMDGLDIYIDDYTQFEPIAPEILSKLAGWRAIEKPLQQIVSPQGHAVDVESEEGQALLQAQRLANERREQDLASRPEPNPGSEDHDEETAAPETLPPPADSAMTLHPRYGLRVGDFRRAPVQELVSPGDTSEQSADPDSPERA